MQRDEIEEAPYLMNLAIKELADSKFEVLLCCCLSILNLFLLTSTNIFLCDISHPRLKNRDEINSIT